MKSILSYLVKCRKKIWLFLNANIIQTIITVFGVGILASLSVFFESVRNIFISAIVNPFLLWMIIIFLVGLNVYRKIKDSYEFKEEEIKSHLIRPRPVRVEYLQSYFIDNMPTVMWKPWRHPDGELEVDGPYCSICGYELDSAQNGMKLRCLKCNKLIKVPRNLTLNLEDKVIKLISADPKYIKMPNITFA